MSLMMALVCVLSLSFTSCSDDDDTAAPAITLGEANLEGDEICVKADIKAPGRTASIIIEVYSADRSTLKTAKVVTDTKYIGVLEIPGFHVHVKDVAASGIVEGDVLVFTVTDMNGKTTSEKKNITAEEEEEEE